MRSRNTSISVRGLSKSYTITHEEEEHITLAETALAWARNPFRGARRETFWALQDVSFEIGRGEVVGIIGRNGAGKSTLLKILSRITTPTSGEADIYGRVGSLLEVGTGFHYELTGRENISLNGAILGMTRSEIVRQFDAIVDFAGVEKFLDTPVKRYSSGMFVRLAFAVAAHLNPEILIVDEVLAVGDADFQKKCVIKMAQVSGEGRTVLFVSHNIGVIRSFCQRGIILSRGELVFDGSANAASDQYLAMMAGTMGQQLRDRTDRAGRGSVRFVAVTLRGLLEDGSGAVVVGSAAEISFRLSQWAEGLTVHFMVNDAQGLTVLHCTTINTSPGDRFVHADADLSEIVWSTDELLLLPGPYSVNASLYRDGTLEDRVEGVTSFDVQPGMVRGRAFSEPDRFGRILHPHLWSVRNPASVSESP